MKSLSYGKMPSKEEFKKSFEKECEDGKYRLGFHESSDDGQSIMTAINQGIDSHLEAIFWSDSGYSKYGHRNITIDDSDSLHTLVRRLSESEDEEAMSLASDIMDTLGYEWI